MIPPAGTARVELQRLIGQRCHRTDVLTENGEDHGCAGNHARIIARDLQCPSCEIDGVAAGRLGSSDQL